MCNADRAFVSLVGLFNTVQFAQLVPVSFIVSCCAQGSAVFDSVGNIYAQKL